MPASTLCKKNRIYIWCLAVWPIGFLETYFVQYPVHKVFEARNLTYVECTRHRCIDLYNKTNRAASVASSNTRYHTFEVPNRKIIPIKSCLFLMAEMKWRNGYNIVLLMTFIRCCARFQTKKLSSIRFEDVQRLGHWCLKTKRKFSSRG